MSNILRLSNTPLSIFPYAAGLKQDVWDIEVEEDHSYIAGGFVNHNSSSKPNLQNIPRDKSIKSMFVPSNSDRLLLQFDLSQAELRIAASVALEEAMLQVYWEEGDIHLKSGMAMLGEAGRAALEAMSPEERQKKIKYARQAAKAMNFGLLYGGSHYVLMELARYQYDVNMTEEEAIAARQVFFDTYPQLPVWHESVSNFAARHGYVLSPMGRLRNLPDLLHYRQDSAEYSAAMRKAINSPVQGCLQSHERILTDAGYREIGRESFCNVWTGEEFAYARVLSMGEASYLNMHVKNTPALHCDDRHSVKVLDGDRLVWKKVTDLFKGELIASAYPVKVPDTKRHLFKIFDAPTKNSTSIILNTHETDIGYFLGYLIGDGCFGINYNEKYDNKLHWVNLCMGGESKKKCLERITRASEAMGYILPELVKGVDGVYTQHIWSKPLVTMLQWLGFIPNCGARGKRIPSKLFGLSDDFKIAILQGLYDSDGIKNINNRGWHITSHGLAKDIYLMLHSFGIASNYYTDGSGNAILSVTSKKEFAELLGLSWDDRLINSGQSLTAYNKVIFLEKAQRAWGKAAKLTASQRVLVSRIRKGGNTTITSAIQILKDLGVRNHGLYLFNAFVKNEEAGYGPTYTLSVQEEKHQYTAAGYISKNCCADFLAQCWTYAMAEMPEARNVIYPVLTVHDSLILDTPKDESLINKTITIFNEATDYFTAVHTRKGWLKCPMRMDAGVGKNWGSIQELKRGERFSLAV